MRKIFRSCLTAIFLGSILSLDASPVVTNVYAGSTQSFLVFSDGSLRAGGNNSYGQLGDGTFNYPIYRFEEVRTNFAAVVATGGNHTLLINNDGSVGAVGDNTAGDLGDGGSNPVNKFEGINVVPTGVIRVAVGVDHSMFIKKNGALLGMGLNSSAQLGDGTENNTNKPEQIVANGVTAVACGSSSTFFIKTGGQLWGTGSLNSAHYDAGFRPMPLIARGAAAVTCGAQYVLVITTNGALLAFGANASGQLGDGTTNATAVPEQILSNGVVAVACGSSHSHFIMSDGSLWAMGNNDVGQLGDGTTNRSLVPEKIVPDSVVAVAAGLGHCLFLKSDGSVWGNGLANSGQLGDGFTNISVLTPRQIYPLAAPVLTNAIAGSSSLQFSATCPSGGSYYLLAATNLAQPIAQWTRVATNAIYDRFNNSFSTTLTNVLTSGNAQQFYLLQSP